MDAGIEPGTLQRLVKTKRVIVATYCKERAKRNSSGTYRLPNHWKKRKKIWRKIVLLVLKNGYDPVAYVQAQFDSPVTFRYPNQMVGPAAEKRYLDTVRGARERIERMLVSQNTRCKGWMRFGEKLRDILENPKKDLTPLFRVCMASSAGYEDIARQYWGGALEQLMMSPYYAGVYEEFIPEELWNQYRSLRESLTRVSCT